MYQDHKKMYNSLHTVNCSKTLASSLQVCHITGVSYSGVTIRDHHNRYGYRFPYHDSKIVHSLQQFTFVHLYYRVKHQNDRLLINTNQEQHTTNAHLHT